MKTARNFTPVEIKKRDPPNGVANYGEGGLVSYIKVIYNTEFMFR